MTHWFKITSPIGLAAFALIFMLGCQTTHKVETDNKITIDPIHITIDVNLNTKLKERLDDALSFQDEFENLE